MSASEKLELIRLIEGSSLSVRCTLAEIGLPRSTFYARYKRYLDGGPEALEDPKPRPRTAWNRIPDRMRAKVIETALVHTELSPRELACRMTDREGEFLSESSVYQILKAADLIESPAYIRLQASDRFQNPTRRRNELWQTDSPTCRWWAGAGTASRLCSTTTRARSWPGSSAPRCGWRT